jgi:deoxyguanosine kinase
MNLLKKFYENPQRWAYTMQVYAFYSRLKHWKNVLEMYPYNVNYFRLNPEESEIILSERSIEADKQIFAINGYEHHLMDSIEFAVYEQFYNWISIALFFNLISKPQKYLAPR